MGPAHWSEIMLRICPGSWFLSQVVGKADYRARFL
jgi:hypothetical protein